MSATTQDDPRDRPAADLPARLRQLLRGLAPTRRGLRFASGVVLFVYLAAHLINHALGLISLAVAETGLDYAMQVWQSRAGTFLLYGAALVHVGLAFEAVYQRRTLLRMPFRDVLRIALGLNLPVLLIAHAASTRLAAEFYDYQLFYADVVRDLWQSGSQMRQFAILAPGWIHGCLGLQAALGRTRWWRRSMPVLFGAFLVVPILSALGFLEMQRELTWFNTMDPKGHGPSVQTMEGIARWRDRAVDVYLALVACLFAARLARWGYERLRGATIEIAYPDARVRAPAGWSVLEASRANHIAHASACGGRARCSTCRVRVLQGAEHCPPPGRNERLTLERIAATPDMRLACQLRPTGPVSVAPLGDVGTAAEHVAHEEVCAFISFDLLNRDALAQGMLPQDMHWALGDLHRAFEAATRRQRGAVVHIGHGHALAAFALGRDARRGCGRAIAAIEELAGEFARASDRLGEHWPLDLRVALAAHVGPVLIDSALLSGVEAKSPVVVGRPIDELDLMRQMLAARGGGLAISRALTELYGQALESMELVPGGEGPDAYVRKLGKEPSTPEHVKETSYVTNL